MLQRLVALTGSLDEEHESLDRFGLSTELLKQRRPERHIERGVRGLGIDGKIFGIHKVQLGRESFLEGGKSYPNS
jgi:hypothetical protein